MKYLVDSNLSWVIAVTVLTLGISQESALANYSRCGNTKAVCLKKGDSGHMVRSLVEDLRKIGYYSARPTDHFDESVEESVKQFQKDHSHITNDPYRGSSQFYNGDLTVDGVFGSSTMKRLCQRAYRGCGPDWRCYTGSPKWMLPCLEKYALLLAKQN